jgi:hypothetical protein
VSVRRRYLLALALAALLAVAWFVVPQAVDSVRSQHRRAELAAALTGLRRLEVPRNFVRLTSNCDWYRCYHILRQPPQHQSERTLYVARTRASTVHLPSAPSLACYTIT